MCKNFFKVLDTNFYPMYLAVPHQMPPKFIYESEVNELEEGELGTDARYSTVEKIDGPAELFDIANGGYTGHQKFKVAALAYGALGKWWACADKFDPQGPFETEEEAADAAADPETFGCSERELSKMWSGAKSTVELAAG